MRPDLALLAVLLLAGGALGEERKGKVFKVGVLVWQRSDFSATVREWIRKGLLSHTRLPLQIEETLCIGDKAKAEKALKRRLEEGVDLLVGIGPEASRFLVARAPGRPVVFASRRDPVRAGIAKRMGAGGGNLTGVCFRLDAGKVMALFRATVPGLTRLGVLYSADLPGPGEDVESAEKALKRWPKTGTPLHLVKGPVDRRGGTDAVIEGLKELVAKGIEAVWLPDDPFLLERLQVLERAANRAGVPILATHPYGVRRHTVIGISPDYRKLGIRAAALCARILRDGAKPGDIPVEVVRTHKVVINVRAAQRAGVRVPMEALTRADEIIDSDGW